MNNVNLFQAQTFCNRMFLKKRRFKRMLLLNSNSVHALRCIRKVKNRYTMAKAAADTTLETLMVFEYILRYICTSYINKEGLYKKDSCVWNEFLNAEWCPDCERVNITARLTLSCIGFSLRLQIVNVTLCFVCTIVEPWVGASLLHTHTSWLRTDT